MQLDSSYWRSGVDFINIFKHFFANRMRSFFGAQIGQTANSICQKVPQFRLEIWSFNCWWNWTANFFCAPATFLPGEIFLVKSAPGGIFTNLLVILCTPVVYNLFQVEKPLKQIWAFGGTYLDTQNSANLRVLTNPGLKALIFKETIKN